MQAYHKTVMLGLAFTLGMTSSCIADATRIHISDGVLYFTGEISFESFEEWKRVTSDLKIGDVDQLVVNSGGGDTVLGRKMGKWIHDMGLDIEVEGMCFSSCANYLFPAAKRKVIRDGAFVGWHGSETQEDVLALSDPNHSADELRRLALTDALQLATEKNLKDEELAKLVDEQMQDFAQSRAEEAAFFDEICPEQCNASQRPFPDTTSTQPCLSSLCRCRGQLYVGFYAAQ